MTFSEALKELYNGEAIAHKDYNGYYQYNGSSIWYTHFNKDGQTQTGVERVFNADDIMRDDWEIVDNCVPEPMFVNMTYNVTDLIDDEDGYYVKILLPYKKDYIKKFKKINIQICPDSLDKEDSNEKENDNVKNDNSENNPMSRTLNYVGYYSHDCEAFYECPACGKSYTSWGFFHKGLNGGDSFECECGTLLRVPQ